MLRNLIIVIISLMAFAPSVQAATSRCRTNANCPESWRCIGGTASSDDFTGTCKPGILLVQLCNLHAIVSGRVARLATLAVILWLGFKFFTSPRDVGGVSFVPMLLTFVGAGLAFGSFQVLSLLIRRYGSPCSF